MYLIPNLKGAEIVKYLRKSRSDDPLLSVEEVLASHEQIIRDWMAQVLPDCGPVPEEQTFREVVSGETLDGRPKMMALLRMVENPKIKAIVCKEPSRLSRGDLQDIGYLVKILRYTNTLVLTPRGSYDLRDDRDREQFERELMRGNDYLEYQKKIMFDGKLQKVRAGQYIGSRAPYGYKKVAYKDGRTTCRTLEPHPEEAPVVKRIFEMYSQGIGSARICGALDAEHIKPMDGEFWSTTSVREILINHHYIGKVRWNRRMNENQVEGGEIKKRRVTAEDFLLFDGLHPAIVPMELWDAAQSIRGDIPRATKKSGLKNPLAGVLRCSCGKMMVYKQVTSKRRPVGLPRVMCGRVMCRENGSAVLGEVVDEVIHVLREAINDFELQIDAGVDDSAEVHRQAVERLEHRLDELRELETKQWDEKLRGKIPDHVFDALNARTVTEIAEVTQALCEMREATPVHVDLQEKVGTFYAALDALQDPDVPVEEQNKLVRACIEQIIYSRPNLDQGKGKDKPPFKLEFTLRI